MKLPAHDTLRAMLLALASFTLFAFVDVFAKWLGHRYDVAVVLLFCSVTGLSMLVPFILWRRGLAGFVPRQPLKLHICRAIQTTLNGFLIIKALQYIPLADYYGIVFAAPLVTAAMAVFFFREHVGWHRWGAIVVGLAGIWIVVAPSWHGFNAGLLAALCVPFTLAANAMFLRKIGRDEYPALFPFYSLLGLLAFNLPAVIVTGAALPAPGHLWIFLPYALCVLLAIALLGRAYAISPLSSSVAPLQYTTLLWGCLFGTFLFHETPSWNTWAGAAVIVAAGLYLFHRERIHAKAV